MPPRKKKTKKPISPPLITPQYAVIRQRIKEFELSVVQEDDCIIDTQPKDQAKLYEELKFYGIVLYNSMEEKKTFLCMASPDCVQGGMTIKLATDQEEEGPIRWLTSNPMRHLFEKHNILSDFQKRNLHKKNTEEEERHMMLVKFDGNMQRLCELQWTKMIMLARLPFTFSTLKVVRDTMHYSCIEEMNLKLSMPRVLHLATEIYSQVLCVVKEMISSSIEAHGKRIFSINVDGWKPKNSIRKFVGLRLYFMDPQYILTTIMLAIREFNPSSAMRTGEDGLSTSMRVWLKGMLSTFGLTFEHIFGSTTDAAGDVRLLCKNDVNANWEWCPPHNINRVLAYTFGKRNPEMMNEIAAMKATIKSLRDHTAQGAIFQETLEDQNPDHAAKVLKTHQNQRFMGYYISLSRYHEIFETIQLACARQNIFNSCSLTKVEVEQLLSLLKPLREISVKTQVQSSPYGYRYLQKMIKERIHGCLNADLPLQHFSNPNVVITELTPRVKLTRKLLIDAVDVKFFSRYFRKKDKSTELKQDLMLECQHILHPAFRQINVVNDVIAVLVHSESLAIGGQWCKDKKKSCRNWAAKSREKRSKDLIFSELWTTTKEKLIEVTRAHVMDTVRSHIVDTIMQSKSAMAENEVKDDLNDLNEVFSRQATLYETSMEQEYFQARGGFRDQSSNVPAVLTFVEKRRRVQEELLDFLSSEGGEAFRNASETLDIPLWVIKYGRRLYPDLTRCIASYFGIPSSSSGIELDFYFNSLILTKRRMSMRGEVAEMLHMTDRNRRFIDLSQVRRIVKRKYNMT